jgi:hypothetical protein
VSGTPDGVRARAGYLALALATIAIGLVIHRARSPLGSVARDIIGDMLWAMMMVWWISVLAPSAALRARAATALCICWAVELSQLLHTPALDAFRGTTVGHLVLGSGFDRRDLLAYTLGVLSAAALDRMATQRRRRTVPLPRGAVS